jgi:hypothetical protein
LKLNYLAQFNDISESIEKYEGVSGPTDEITDILNSYKKLDIKAPMPGCLKTSVRELIHQGPLKLKDLSKSFDVYCFLFTDMLLITQQKKSKKYKIIKPPVSTHRMLVRELSQTDKSFAVISLNDYEVPDSVCMFISAQSKKWIEFLESSKKKYLIEMDKLKSKLLQNQQQYYSLAIPPTPKMSINLKRDSFESGSDITSSSNEIETNNINNIETIQEEKYCQQESTTRRSSSETIIQNQKPIEQIDNEKLNNLIKKLSEDVSDDNNNDKIVEETTNNNNQKFLSSSVSSQSSFTSYDIEPQTHNQLSKQLSTKKFQKNGGFTPNSRLLDRRIERQRRNMTDPTQQHSSSNIGDERHSIIMKRNSLNDKSSTNRNESPTSNAQPQSTVIDNQKLINLCGDSTSTIMSTDSGVSSTSNCNENHNEDNNNGHNSQRSPKKYIILNKVAHINSQKSNNKQQEYVNVSANNFSSKNNKQLMKKKSLDEHDISLLESNYENYSSSKNDNYMGDHIDLDHDEDDILIGAGNVDYDNFDSSTDSTTSHIYENINKSSNNNVKLTYMPLMTHNNDVSLQLLNNLTSKYYDYVNKSNCLDNNNNDSMTKQSNNINTNKSNNVNKSDLDKFIITQNVNSNNTNTNQFKIPNTFQLQKQKLKHNGDSPNLDHHEIRKPLIKIKTASLGGAGQNFHHQHRSSNLHRDGHSSLNSSPSNFDSTIESALFNGSNQNKKSNQNTIDNYNPLMLVKLIHATMDAT